MLWTSCRTDGLRSLTLDNLQSRVRRLLRCGLFPALVVSAGCAADADAPSEGAAAVWAVAEAPSLVLGSANGPEAQLFEAVVSAVPGPNGEIIVADGGSLDVRVFDAAGELAVGFGREGEGPGEFMSVTGLWITPEDQIAVWDAALRRISVFSLEGSLATSSQIATSDGPEGGNVEPFIGPVAGGDVVLAALHFGARSAAPSPDRWELLRFGPDAQVRAQLGSADGFWRSGGGPVPLTQIPSIATLDDRIYIVDGYDPEIRVIGDAGTEEPAVVVPDLTALSQDEAWAGLEPALQEQAEYSEFARMLLEQLQAGDIPRDGRVPSIAALLADEGGMLWIKEFDPAADPLWLRANALRPGAGGQWRVLAPTTGEVVARLPMAPGVVPLHIGNERLLGLAVDDLGVQTVVAHSIVRGSR